MFMLTREEADAAHDQLMLRISQGQHGEDAFPVDINFGEHARTRAVVRLGGLAVRGAGTIRFRLQQEQQELGVWEVEVRQLPIPPAEVVAAAPVPRDPGSLGR